MNLSSGLKNGNYRITPTRIEVLKAISSRMSISRLRVARKIKI
jgi:Fe2+ or Zn2+ uptake regulation protein